MAASPHMSDRPASAARIEHGDQADQIDLSISIVSFNTRDVLDDCLQHVLASVGEIDFEVVVVDNGSSDGSTDLVKAKYPQVRLIANPSNRYFSAAHNQAASVSRGRCILIMNSDILVSPDTLDLMVRFMEEHPSVGAASCTLVGARGGVEPLGYRFQTVKSVLLTHQLGLWGRKKAWFDAHIGDWDRLTTRSIDVVSDAFMCVRHVAWNAIGGYDEQFLLYCTEDDVCLRLKQAGWDVYHYAGASAQHLGQASTRRRSPWTIAWIHRRDLARYFQKHHGWVQAQVINAFWAIDIVVRVPARYIMSKVRELRSLSRSSPIR